MKAKEERETEALIRSVPNYLEIMVITQASLPFLTLHAVSAAAVFPLALLQVSMLGRGVGRYLLVELGSCISLEKEQTVVVFCYIRLSKAPWPRLCQGSFLIWKET